jgi:hypothetical protein
MSPDRDDTLLKMLHDSIVEHAKTSESIDNFLRSLNDILDKVVTLQKEQIDTASRLESSINAQSKKINYIIYGLLLIFILAFSGSIFNANFKDILITFISNVL